MQKSILCAVFFSTIGFKLRIKILAATAHSTTEALKILPVLGLMLKAKHTFSSQATSASISKSMDSRNYWLSVDETCHL